MKLIDKHNKWIEQGYIDDENGLCQHMHGYEKSFGLFIPSKSAIFWAYSRSITYNKEDKIINKKGWQHVGGKYSKLRQTIVLLICAMHDEI